LQALLGAPDRDALLEWLLHRPLLHRDESLNLVLLHAGLPPQWDVPTAEACAREFEAALRRDPRELFAHMYGDQPDLWSERLEGAARLRFIANCLTRLRFLDGGGRLALRAKGAPGEAREKALVPWFEADAARWRTARIVFGHWSTLGLYRDAGVLALDTGCVWGGSLTAVRLDDPGFPAVSVACAATP
jgi:bis(5'-nucleosyl)-tetraphosphatase (symmetrical)